jgi:hypothetical protein
VTIKKHHIILFCFACLYIACAQAPEAIHDSPDTVQQQPQILHETADATIKNDDALITSSISKKKEVKPIELVEADVATAYESDLIPAVKNNFYSCMDNICTFESNIEHERQRSVGCSGGQTQFSLKTKTDGDKFNCNGEECNLFEFKYDYSGGLYGKSVNRIESGYILGDRLTDGSWKVKVDVVVRITDIFMESGSERIQLEEVFLPR